MWRVSCPVAGRVASRLVGIGRRDVSEVSEGSESNAEFGIANAEVKNTSGWDEIEAGCESDECGFTEVS
jgi:hypothetical protein